MARLQKHKTIRQALQYVSDRPDWPTDEVTGRMDLPVWELVARNLFDIANHPDASSKAKMAQTVRAQKIILDRLTGTRRQGTHPAVRNTKTLKMRDLTEGIDS